MTLVVLPVVGTRIPLRHDGGDPPGQHVFIRVDTPDRPLAGRVGVHVNQAGKHQGVQES